MPSCETLMLSLSKHVETCGALRNLMRSSRDRAAHKQEVSLMMGERGMFQ